MAEKRSPAPVQSSYNDVDFPRGPPPPPYTPTAPPGTQVLPVHNYPIVPQPAVQPVQPTVIVTPAIQQPVYIPSGTLQVGPRPAVLKCPNCHQQVKTRTETVAQKGAHIACVILCLLGFCLCSCIPYCLRSCQNVNHYCPKCKAFIGCYHS